MATRAEIFEILEDTTFTAKLRHTESGWWIAHCEAVPEARTQGKTKEEVLENLKDAIALILEDYAPKELEQLRSELALEERELLTL